MRSGSLDRLPLGRWCPGAFLGFLTAGLLGCGNLLEVENPNSFRGEDVEVPANAEALVNGAQFFLHGGIDFSTLTAAIVTDEMDFVGGFDSGRELEQGKLSNAYNSFTNLAMPLMGQARWLADEAVKILERQQADGTLLNPLNLAKAYLWAAVARTSIADLYDDWTLSDRDSAAAPVGEAAMGGFYDTAIDYLNKGLAIATGRDAALALTIRAMRARASFGRAIWDLVGQRPISASHLVSATSSYTTNAVTDAQAVLAAAPTATWNYRFTSSVATGAPPTGQWVSQRQEMRVGRVFALPSPSGPGWTASFITDPIDVTTLAKVPNDVQAELKTRYPPYTVVSAREMHLIIAEARLAAGAVTGVNSFTSQINALRALDGLTPYSGQIAPEAMLAFSRKTNLFYQGRALADHYRFRLPPADWLPGQQGLEGGWFLPIASIVCLSNPYIGPEKCRT